MATMSSTPSETRNAREWKLTFIKLNRRALQKKATDGYLSSLVTSLNNASLRNRGYVFEPEGWTSRVPTPDELKSDPALAVVGIMTVILTYANDRSYKLAEADAEIRKAAQRSDTNKFGHWQLSYVDGKPYEMGNGSAITADQSLLGYVPVNLPDNWRDYFRHIYGLDAQITMAIRAIEAGIRSDWQQRQNIVFYGPPGCGKTEIMRAVKAMLNGEPLPGESREDYEETDETRAVYEFDATATTAAGIYKTLADLPILPRLMLLEEAEKAPEASTQPTLSIFDSRGEARKTTAKSKINLETKLMGIATVNDMSKWQKLHAGALASRFALAIPCPKPSREVKRQILVRELDTIKADHAIADAVLDWTEDHDLDDNRQMIALCLTGAEGWLPGPNGEAATFPELLEAVNFGQEWIDPDKTDNENIDDLDWGDES